MAFLYQQSSEELLCPFEPAINPAAAWAQETTTTWAQTFGLLQTPEALEEFGERKYAFLMARAYPTAPPDMLAAIADWNTWLFLLDDQLDEQALGKDPAELRKLAAEIIAVLRGAQPQMTTFPPLYALADVATRLRPYLHPVTLRRLIAYVTQTFPAMAWEAENRIARRIPAEHEYRKQRPLTSGVFCYLPLIEIAEHIILTDIIHAHPLVQRLNQLTNNSICWANDILSLSKEQAAGDVHNLVYIVQNERQFALDEAIHYVTLLHNKDVVEFQTLAAHMPFFDNSTNVVLQKYVQGLQWWMRANMDWSAETSRYT